MNILICPGSAENQKCKRWPVKNFLELIKKLKIKKYNIKIVLGPEEEYLSKFFKMEEIIFSHSFENLKVVSSMTDLVVCNDSFLMHFFSFLKRKVLVLYGPTYSYRTLPPNAYKIENYGKFNKKPCWGSKEYGKCNYGRCSCFDLLNSEIVYKKCLKILDL